MSTFVRDPAGLQPVAIICEQGKIYATWEFLQASIPVYMAKMPAEIDLAAYKCHDVEQAIFGRINNIAQLEVAKKLSAKVKWFGSVEDACAHIDIFTEVVGFDKLVKRISKELAEFGPRFIAKYAKLCRDAHKHATYRTERILQAKRPCS